MVIENTTISLRKIALDLLSEESENDAEYQRLLNIAKERTYTKKESEKYEELAKKYDEDNYYRNIQRYTQQIIQFNRDFVKVDGRDEYLIPADQEWLLKAFLREFMKPFSKKSRSKRLTQLTFEEFDDFVGSIEKAIQDTFRDNEDERQYQLHLLNLYTNYKVRRAVFAIKKDIEKLVSKDLAATQAIQNFHARVQFLEEYRKGIKRLSDHFQKEIAIHVDAEEALRDDMIEENISLTEGLYTDEEVEALKEAYDQDVPRARINYNEVDLSEILRKSMSDDEKTRMQRKLEQWKKIIRAEYD